MDLVSFYSFCFFFYVLFSVLAVTLHGVMYDVQFSLLLLMNRLEGVFLLYFWNGWRMILNSVMVLVLRMEVTIHLLMMTRTMICLKIGLALHIILTENLGWFMLDPFVSFCSLFSCLFYRILMLLYRPSLKGHMQYCLTHPEEMSKLSKLKAQITEVKGVMMDNIEKVCDC